MESDTKFAQSFDARDWARAFVAHVKANPSIATDEGTMIGWFANAIMRGYDEDATTSQPPLGGTLEQEMRRALSRPAKVPVSLGESFAIILNPTILRQWADQVAVLEQEKNESEIAFLAAHKELDETQAVLGLVEFERDNLKTALTAERRAHQEITARLCEAFAEDNVEDALSQMEGDLESWRKACADIKEAEHWPPNAYPSMWDRWVYAALFKRATEAEDALLVCQQEKDSLSTQGAQLWHRVDDLQQGIDQIVASLIKCEGRLRAGEEIGFANYLETIADQLSTVRGK